MTQERFEVFKEYLRKWPWDQYETMPIAKVEGEYLIKLFDQMDREREQKKEYYKKTKAKAFIREATHD